MSPLGLAQIKISINIIVWPTFYCFIPICEVIKNEQIVFFYVIEAVLHDQTMKYIREPLGKNLNFDVVNIPAMTVL